MSIHVEGPHNPTHQENLMWQSVCHTCPDYSEEDGTIYDPPRTLVGWWEDVTYSVAMEKA